MMKQANRIRLARNANQFLVSHNSHQVKVNRSHIGLKFDDDDDDDAAGLDFNHCNLTQTLAGPSEPIGRKWVSSEATTRHISNVAFAGLAKVSPVVTATTTVMALA